MIEPVSQSRSSLKGQVLGYMRYDKLRVAVLHVDGDKILGCEFLKFFSPHQAVGYFVERPKPLGIGLMETLAWGTGKEGWKASDFWMDEAPYGPEKGQFDEFPFYFGPFSSSYSCTGMVLLSLLRQHWPGLAATETAPMACYWHIMKSKKRVDLGDRIATLSQWLKFDLPKGLNSEEWFALMSAYAMWMGLAGDWPIDLHRLTRPRQTGHRWEKELGTAKEWTEETYEEPAMSYETLIVPPGPVSFFWPPDERAAV